MGHPSATTATPHERVKLTVPGNPQLSARDALHAAVMRRHEIADIMSFDTGFHDVPGITRLRLY